MEENRLKLSEVSKGLRRALVEGHWPTPRHTALGLGSDGKQYYATAYPGVRCERGLAGWRRRKAWAEWERRVMDRVVIEELPYRPERMALPEPDGVVWKPALTEERRWVPLEAAGEGLRQALEEARQPDGWSYAVGIAPNGMRCQAYQRENHVRIREELGAGALTDHWIAEPEGAVWRPCLPDRVPVKLEAVSEGLRKALEEAQWPSGHRGAVVGMGPDGTEYEASLRGYLVFIHETFAFTSFDLAIPEPEGIVWKPAITKEDWGRLETVSEGLRAALEGAEPWFSKRYASGVGPDGIRYSAQDWRGGFVFIDYMDAHAWGDCRSGGGRIGERARIPIPEPEGVVWTPFRQTRERPCRLARGLHAIKERGQALWQAVRRSMSRSATEAKRVPLAAVSEGLRRALEEGKQPYGLSHAKGAGPRGMLYRASLRDDGVLIYDAFPTDREPIAIPEPQGLVWRPVFRGENLYLFEDVSEGLRQALQESRWPYGQRIARGIGSDGTEYQAKLYGRLVYIDELIRENPSTIPIAEPEDVVWQPLLTEKECVRLADVSEGLRKALENGCTRFAHGKGPDGTNYMAYVWDDDRVFIEVPGWELALKYAYIPRHLPPLPEPEGVVWEPSVP